MPSEDLSGKTLSCAVLSAGRYVLFYVRRSDAKIYKKRDGMFDRKVERTAHCMVTPTGQLVTIDFDYEKQNARFGGVQTCGSVWACPVCSWAISKGRRDELVKISAIMEKDYYALHIILTISHNANHYLRDSMQALASATQKLRSGKRWESFRVQFGYDYDLTATEGTWGWTNGWHPHKHLLAYCKKSVVDKLVYQLPDSGEFVYGLEALPLMVAEFYTERWLHVLENDKYGFSASAERGVVVKNSPSDISDYIAKFGYVPGGWRAEDELTRSNSKLGRSTSEKFEDRRFTPFQLLEEYFFNGSDWAAEKWLEFIFVMKGRHQLQFMRGFKPYLVTQGLNILSDEELATQESKSPFYDLFMSFNLVQWRQIMRSGVHPYLLDFVESVGADRAKVIQFLLEKGVDIRSSDDSPV